MPVNPDTLWRQLKEAGLASGDPPEISDHSTPWYIRLMLGIAGVIGAVFLLIFVWLGLTFIVESGTLAVFFGITFCVVAAAVYSRSGGNDFADQFAFTLSLAGQGLTLYGLTELLQPHREIIAAVMAFIQAGLFLLIPSFQHRIWSALAGTYAIVYVLNAIGLSQFVLVLLFAACLVVLLNEFRYPRYAVRLRALGYGLVIMLFYYLLGGARGFLLGILFRPIGNNAPFLGYDGARWLNALLLAAVMLYAVVDLLRRNRIELHTVTARIFITLAVVLALVSIKLIGVPIMVTILIIGFANGNRILTGFGVAGLIAYMSRYYYFLNLTLLEKSMVLLATGAALLGIRYALLRWWPDTGGKGERYA